MVPFIDINRTEPGFKERWTAKVAELTERSQFIGGAELATLEARLAERSGLPHVVGCANGTDAIQLALRAVGVGRGDAVLVPDLTFWATFEAVVNVGAAPVTVDASLLDGGVDFAQFERALVEAKPKAAVIAHLYGWGSTHLAEMRALCDRHGVMLVEDGAQCFGASYQGKPILADAAIATTSFYPAKVLGAAGDGGAVFTRDPVLAERVRMLANHGRTSHYGYGAVGWNSRLDTLQAAFLNLALDHLDDRIASRRKSAVFYHERLGPLGLQPMRAPAAYDENGYCNVILVPDAARKNRIETVLKEKGIGYGNIYPGPMSVQPGATTYLKASFGGDAAKALCAMVLNLPLFPYMTSQELDEVLDALQQVASSEEATR